MCATCRHDIYSNPCPKCGRRKRKESEACRLCSSLPGSSSPSWKGGKIHLRSSGYVYATCSTHPRATSNGYVLEHILVMEKSLGRYLLPKETVHHKNGQKNDNRIENLELWSGNHPTGCRVEDLFSWAKEILKTYGNGPGEY